MGYFVGAFIFLGMGMAFGSWYFDAHRRWLDALARHDELPMGGTELLRSGFLRPRESARSLAAIARRAYPSTSKSRHRDVELWRVRRRRRLSLFVGWMVLGGPISIVVMASVDAADSLRWLLLIPPIAAAAAAVGVAIRHYGLYEPPADDPL